MEIYSDCKVQLVDYTCDDCNIGTMKYNGIICFTFPEQYEHKCNHCGTIKLFQEKYPRIDYKYKR